MYEIFLPIIIMLFKIQLNNDDTKSEKMSEL